MANDDYEASRMLAKVAKKHLDKFVSGKSDDLDHSLHLLKAARRAHSVEEGVTWGLH